jgi:predicted DNA-binding ribbon-helix-helix protein
MPSDRQIAANRNNAKKSTGPRSQAGREASRRNARRHGLAIAIRTDPAFQDDLEKLAKALSLSRGMQNVDERAREAAGAELDLLRIRKIRAFLFETLSATLSNLAEVNDKLAKLERYERSAFSRRNRALREM